MKAHLTIRGYEYINYVPLKTTENFASLKR